MLSTSSRNVAILDSQSRGRLGRDRNVYQGGWSIGEMKEGEGEGKEKYPLLPKSNMTARQTILVYNANLR